ncbi:MAG: type II toxin-antitoxin system PemK/MazF family toxin [Gemmataceae bacterium]
MPIHLGEFWVADISFTSGSGPKKRPVLVLWLDGLDAVVTAVTSAAPPSATDVPLADWRLAALRVPSTVRLSRLDGLEQVREKDRTSIIPNCHRGGSHDLDA